MIHRQSRNELALILRQYVAGLKTNDDLDNVVVDCRDRGAMAVKQEAWFLYDDNYQHRAIGQHSIGRSDRREIARMILFLHSNKEYLWPDYRSVPIFDFTLNLFTLGLWGKKAHFKYKQFLEAGDFKAWPFISDIELEHALVNPKYLAGI